MFVQPVYANCPVCIITVGGGLFIAKKLGIDDLLVSIWIAGLNTAIAFWLATIFKNKLLKNSYVLSFIFYFLTLGYLIISKQIGHKGNQFLRIDKVIFGLTIGTLVFFISVTLDKFIRSKNKNKVLFPYQKVIVPLIILTITTFIFKILLKK